MSRQEEDDSLVPQSGVVPLRPGGDGWEVLLITAKDGSRWGIPKGKVEPELTPLESAAKEAYEEAGIRGDVDPQPLGEYQYIKAGRGHRVRVYRMVVRTVLKDWPESGVRLRRWMPAEEAADLVWEDKLQRMILAAGR